MRLKQTKILKEATGDAGELNKAAEKISKALKQPKRKATGYRDISCEIEPKVKQTKTTSSTKAPKASGVDNDRSEEGAAGSDETTSKDPKEVETEETTEDKRTPMLFYLP